MLLFVPSVTAFATESSTNGFTVSYEQDGNDVFVCFDYTDEVVKQLLGDTDNDGKFTAADARTALRASVRLDILSEEDNVVADTDCDGKVTAADARTILRVSAKLQVFKIDVEQETLIRRYAHLQNTTKELTVQGETLKAAYAGPKKAEGVQKHDRLVYVTADNEVLQYDAVTGDLVFLQRLRKNENPSRISETQALKIANEFIGQHCDLSKYSLVDSKYNEHTGYTIQYSFLIDGYRTTDGVAATVTDSGEIRFFFYNPYVFDDVEIKPIDGQSLLTQLDQQVRADNKDSLVSYEVELQRLAVDKNNQLIMEYTVSIEFSVTNADGKKSILVKGNAYQFKV